MVSSFPVRTWLGNNTYILMNKKVGGWPKLVSSRTGYLQPMSKSKPQLLRRPHERRLLRQDGLEPLEGVRRCKPGILA